MESDLTNFESVIGLVFDRCPGCSRQDLPLKERIYDFSIETIAFMGEKQFHVHGFVTWLCEFCFEHVRLSQEHMEITKQEGPSGAAIQLRKNVFRFMDEGIHVDPFCVEIPINQKVA